MRAYILSVWQRLPINTESILCIMLKDVTEVKNRKSSSTPDWNHGPICSDLQPEVSRNPDEEDVRSAQFMAKGVNHTGCTVDIACLYDIPEIRVVASNIFCLITTEHRYYFNEELWHSVVLIEVKNAIDCTSLLSLEEQVCLSKERF